jgi:hypothetical protein
MMESMTSKNLYFHACEMKTVAVLTYSGYLRDRRSSQYELFVDEVIGTRNFSQTSVVVKSFKISLPPHDWMNNGRYDKWIPSLGKSLGSKGRGCGGKLVRESNDKFVRLFIGLMYVWIKRCVDPTHQREAVGMEISSNSSSRDEQWRGSGDLDHSHSAQPELDHHT